MSIMKVLNPRVIQFTQATHQGPRTYQEDRMQQFPVKGGHLFGVFDGHGLDLCSKLCGQIMEDAWHSAGDNRPVNRKLRHMISAMESGCFAMTCGTTASLVYVDEVGRFAWCAVIGDSPILIQQNNGTWLRSPEHNARTNEADRNAAISRGGGHYGDGYLYNDRGYIIQLTRALGDCQFGKMLSKTPEIYSVGDVRRIVLCTDGLLDPGHASTEIPEWLTQAVESGCQAETLVQHAIGTLRVNDNVSCFVIGCNT
jgi:serine/threonine protein phosphatase PrpC